MLRSLPLAATVFGDPHVYTFDDLQYTFNGKGEFVMVRVDSVRHVLDVQGRFEQIPVNYLGEAKASTLTAVAGTPSSLPEALTATSQGVCTYPQ